MHIFPKALVSVAVLLAAAPAVRAQDINFIDYNAINVTSQRETALRETLLGVNRGSANSTKKAVASKAAHPVAAPAAGLTYTPTSTLKTSTVQGYVERLKAKNPAASQAVATNFGSGKNDYGTIYQGIVKPYGIRPNDAVDAMVANMVLGYMVVNDLQGEGKVSAAQVAGVRAQFGPRLSQSPKLRAPGVAAQLGEEMKLQFVVLQGGWQSAIKEGKLPAYQQGIAALFKNQYGLDLSQLTITAKGFVKK